jgi:hypothetical protein
MRQAGDHHLQRVARAGGRGVASGYVGCQHHTQRRTVLGRTIAEPFSAARARSSLRFAKTHDRMSGA